MINNHEQLKNSVYNGAKDKNLVITDTILDRISYELSIIEKQGFTDYFILYSRIIEICNEIKLLRSYGRGSAANSIVNYCLDITKINPIDENLIFERFIHPQQKQLPDIDIDIPMGYQKNVIELLKQKYPEYNTYYIAFVPKVDTDYKDVVYNNEIFKKHPCGIVISTENIPNQIFKFQDEEYCLITNYSNDPVCNNKIDILELEYLNRLQLIVNEIGEEFHPYKLPLNDKKVFDFFASGDLENVFQFNTASMKGLLSRFCPNSLNDLSIIIAMFRPGFVEYIPTVIKNKFNSTEQFEFSDKRVSKILQETYGFIIYQETFLHLSKEISGINFSESEIWRKKIMRDKSNLESIAFSSLFAKGCRENSILNEVEITTLTNLITELLRLTFQKSHSLSYSLVGYWGCYYKTYFREHFDNVFKSDIKFQAFELYQKTNQRIW
jgi:DNA polymerase-3 subunit alpha